MLEIMPKEEGKILIYKSIARVHHVHKDIWTTIMGEMLEVQRQPENERGGQAVCLLKSSAIVGIMQSYNR